MKKWILFAFFAVPAVFTSAQSAGTLQVASGAVEQLETLLDKPAMIKAAVASPLGKNWFRLETDAHVFTTQANARQIAAVLLDVENQEKYFNGRKSKLTAKLVSRSGSGSLIDFVSISVAGPIQIKTPYRAMVTSPVRTDSKIGVEVKQDAGDSAKNNDIKNLFATRYAEDVVIGGKKYTYIRFYTIDDVNASILPGAQGALERNSEPTNVENLNMAISAGRGK
ncbi:MAG: hypothetical protein LBG79_01955 [Spirochaetaceae bacterium]|jgi:hypothetical protein|nr:hypothetical protein [Spirochaetaceae bacterium]